MKIYWPNHWKKNKYSPNCFALFYLGYERDEYSDDNYPNNFMFIALGLGINFAFRDRK